MTKFQVGQWVKDEQSGDSAVVTNIFEREQIKWSPDLSKHLYTGKVDTTYVVTFCSDGVSESHPRHEDQLTLVTTFPMSLTSNTEISDMINAAYYMDLTPETWFYAYRTTKAHDINRDDYTLELHGRVIAKSLVVEIDLDDLPALLKAMYDSGSESAEHLADDIARIQYETPDIEIAM